MPPAATLTPGDAVLLMLAASVLTVGAAVLGMTAFHQRATERSTAWFGAFCLLYGTRLTTALFQEIAHPSHPPATYEIIRVVATYVILVPLTLFAWEIFGQGWRRSIRLLVILEVGFAVAGVASDLVQRRPGTLLPLHPFVVVLAAVVLFANALRTVTRASREVQIVEYGLLAFVFVLLTPSVSRILHHRLLFNPEPTGLVIFVCCFGYVATSRLVRNERRLVALERELDTARRIQASILPQQMPGGPGLEIVARYAPMEAVAGDFYDFVPVDGGRLGIFIADVSGHGVAAALIASMLKVALVSQTGRAGDPAALMAGLNGMLCGRFDREYVTAGYLLVDSGRRTITYAGAGHPLPVMLTPGGTAEMLDQNGLMLGLFDGAPYANLVRPIEPGTRVVLYTDGVTEAANAGDEFFGPARLRAFAERRRDLQPAPFADALLGEIAAWTGPGARREDDITLVVVDIAA
ncbi:MAG: PP2C family protein-serine/threonine phosphatase [Acidobacteriota bacterium]|nr:PP2C family protein-serine/threonine phosphatase [Acidobacteriota bacterium]